MRASIILANLKIGCGTASPKCFKERDIYFESCKCTLINQKKENDETKHTKQGDMDLNCPKAKEYIQSCHFPVLEMKSQKTISCGIQNARMNF